MNENNTKLNLRKILREFEKGWINWALNQSRGNKAQAAKMLGVGRAMLSQKIKRWGLKKYEVMPTEKP